MSASDLFDVSLLDWHRQVAQWLSGFKGNCVVKGTSIKWYPVTHCDTCATGGSIQSGCSNKAQTLSSEDFLDPAGLHAGEEWRENARTSFIFTPCFCQNSLT